MAVNPSDPDITGSSDLTGLLQRMQAGDQAASEKAVGLVYGELHRIAARQLRKERPDHLLQATALIHEAFERLVHSRTFNIKNRGQFFAIASEQMRRILVEYARSRNAQRRGSGAINLELDGLQVGVGPKSIDLLLLDESLQELQAVDPRACKVVEMRFFGGYGDREVSEALGVSSSSVRRDWDFARSWLFDRMSGLKAKAAAVAPKP